MRILPIYYAYESISGYLGFSVRNNRWVISQRGYLSPPA
jgi:hypothetical protein